MALELSLTPEYRKWLTGLKEKIRNRQLTAALKVNTEALSLYWELGKAIDEKQAESKWGDKIIAQLSQDLHSEFPEIKGFSPTNLKSIRKWYRFYSSIGQQPVVQLEKIQKSGKRAISQQPVGQLRSGSFPSLLGLIPWGHHIQIIAKAKDIQEALYYIQQTAANDWSRNILIHQMESKIYQHKGKALTNFQFTLPTPQSELARELLFDEYNLDFLTLSLQSSERELEKSIIANIQKFLLALGKGFSFMGQQYHLKVGGNDYYIDLLFYHTRLHCYVVVELKISEFIPEFAGKLEFYLTAVDEQLKSEIENPTIGLLLCKSYNKTIVEYSLKDKAKPMGVVTYKHALSKEFKAELPSVEILKEQLDIVTKNISPLQEKIAQLKELIAKSGREELQKEKSKEDVYFLFNDLLPTFEKAIRQNLDSVIPEFKKVEVNRMVNKISGPLVTADIEKKLQHDSVNQLGLYLVMEGFKKAGTKAFDIRKEIIIDLNKFKYCIGNREGSPTKEKMYHEKWKGEEVQEFTEKWCEEIIEEMTERLKRI